MAWDSTRPVPWRRLVREWAIYAAVMAVIFVVVFRDSTTAGTFIGLVSSLPIYLAFGGILAKFGYQRRTMRDMRAQSARQPSATAAEVPTKAKPAPTRRTGAGNDRRRTRR